MGERHPPVNRVVDFGEPSIHEKDEPHAHWSGVTGVGHCVRARVRDVRQRNSEGRGRPVSGIDGTDVVDKDGAGKMASVGFRG